MKFDDLTNGQTKAVVQKMGGAEIALAYLRGEYVLTKIAQAVQNLLENVGSVVIPATTDKFVAKDDFIRDISVRVRSREDNFTEWFLLDSGKIEDPICEQILCYAKLCKIFNDASIAVELGEEKSETTLTAVRFLMKKQKNGEDGALLTDGNSNIFFIRDRNSALRAVVVSWHGGNEGVWLVGAHSIEYMYTHKIGARVFYNNSVLVSLETSVSAHV